jgi:CxxC motif-containing protein (DUF1111 family)
VRGKQDSTEEVREMSMKRVTVILAATALSSALGCGNQGEDVTTAEGAVVGDPMGVPAGVDFAAAKANFNAIEQIADGVGPVFNERACGTCHSNGASGGAGQQIERRYGRFDNNGQTFNGLANEGGSLRQLFTIGAWKAGCNVALEREPADATVHNVGRMTTPLFGLGLVDSLPDAFFDTLAVAEPATVRGTVTRVNIVLPNVHDASQSVGQSRVARFGWKGGVPDLAQFAADAYVNEMGITTQHCSKGTSVTAFSVESKPNGQTVPVGCDDGAPLQTAADVAATGMQVNTDDAVGSCAGGVNELQEDVNNFTLFMTFLAPTTTDNSDAISINAGRPLFASIGCAGCHVDNTVSTGALQAASTFRTPAAPGNGVPGNTQFHPFSDFLTHDMGALGDQIGNDGDSPATTRRMRTAPLWGIRFRNNKLHDGRTTDVTAAIRAHAGQAAQSVANFNALSSSNQHNVTQFVLSL